jgi:diguanylate cyclase (GGDEF)-like protein
MFATLGKVSNWLLSAAAGVAAFLLTLGGFLLLTRIDLQVAASLVIGCFALLVVWIASERPNSAQARAVAALIERLMAVSRGDLTSPSPPLLREHMPALAGAVDGLFDQVRSTIDTAHSIAMYDPVTALPNRVYFKREAERILKTRRVEDVTALLFVDLDGFKEVNDRLGHAHGDQVLIMVANRLRVVLKAETGAGELTAPLLARLAGDEFTLLLPDIGAAEEAERIALRALAALSEPFRIGGHSPCLGASIGIALCPDHGRDLTTLMKAADLAMYQAKANGRSRICLFDSALAAATEEKAVAELALRNAVEKGELELAYQPQLCLRTGAIVAAEAMIRWNHPSGAVRLPDTIVAMAEACGQILKIGEWSLDSASCTLASWRAAGLDQRMCMRVSPRQIERPDFFARLRDLLARSGPPPWRFEVELSESMIVQCDSRIASELSALRADGVTVAVADFGSGRASLARISELPLDRVKLDSALVREVDTSARARSIVSALVHLIHDLGCEAVAGGVERQEQCEVLRTLGCDTLQGFLCAEAMDETAFIEWALAQDCAHSLARAG